MPQPWWVPEVDSPKSGSVDRPGLVISQQFAIFSYIAGPVDFWVDLPIRFTHFHSMVDLNPSFLGTHQRLVTWCTRGELWDDPTEGRLGRTGMNWELENSHGEPRKITIFFNGHRTDWALVSIFFKKKWPEGTVKISETAPDKFCQRCWFFQIPSPMFLGYISYIPTRSKNCLPRQGLFLRPARINATSHLHHVLQQDGLLHSLTIPKTACFWWSLPSGKLTVCYGKSQNVNG